MSMMMWLTLPRPELASPHPKASRQAPPERATPKTVKFRNGTSPPPWNSVHRAHGTIGACHQVKETFTRIRANLQDLKPGIFLTSRGIAAAALGHHALSL